MVIGSIKRLSKVARDFNVGISTIVDFLHKKGFDIDTNPNNKITDDAFMLLEKEYKGDVSLKKESEKINLKSHRSPKESISLDDVADSGHKLVNVDVDEDEVIIKGHTSLKVEQGTYEPKPARNESREESFEPSRPEIEAPKVVGKIDLDNLGARKKKEESPVLEERAKVVEQTPSVEVKPQPEPTTVVEKIAVEQREPKVEKTTVVSKPETNVVPVQEYESDDQVDSNMVSMDIPKVDEVKVVGRIDLALLNQKTRPAKKSKKQKEEERKDRERVRRDAQKPAESESNSDSTSELPRTAPTVIKANVEKLSGPTVVGKIDLPLEKKPGAPSGDAAQQQNRKKKRKRISKDIPGNQQRVNVAEKPAVPGEKRKLVVTKNPGGKPKPGGAAGAAGDRSVLKKRPLLKKEVSEEDVQKQIKDTLARLTTKGTKSKGSKYRRDKRQLVSDKMAAQAERDSENQSILKVTEFVSVNELATMMDTSVTSVISTCMSLGLFVSINQRLDAETMAIVADEFGFKVEFVSAEIQVAIEEEPDTPEQSQQPVRRHRLLLWSAGQKKR